MPYTRITPPPRYKLSDLIYEQLEKLVVDGVLAVGEVLPSERDLAEQFGVSRPSVREALLKLVARNILSARPGGGYIVASMTPEMFTDTLAQLMERHTQTLRDVIEMRDMLETVAAQLAAERSTDEDKERLGETLTHLERTVLRRRLRKTNPSDGTKRVEELAKLEEHFYLTLARASHNTVLAHTVQSVLQLLRESISRAYQALEIAGADGSGVVGRHRAIFDAVISRDPQRARQAAHEHPTVMVYASRASL